MTMAATEPEAKTTGRRLEGRVALITGGAGGIGLATAKLFASEGAKLVLVDVDAAAAQSAADSAGGPGGLGLKANVASHEEVDAAVKAALDKFGKIDILINNAGITRDNLLIRMSEADWDLVLDVNLKGAFNFSKACARPMMKARYGRIVNVASVVGQMGNVGQANYAASKGGLIAFTKALAKELASRNVHVNAVAPGFIRTKLTDVLPEEAKNILLQMTPMARFGEADEVAKVLLFLSSDDSAYVTGQVVGVNGGMYM